MGVIVKDISKGYLKYNKPIGIKATSAPDDSAVANGELVLWFDLSTGRLKSKAKDLSGTVYNRTYSLYGVAWDWTQPDVSGPKDSGISVVLSSFINGDNNYHLVSVSVNTGTFDISMGGNATTSTTIDPETSRFTAITFVAPKNYLSGNSITVTWYPPSAMVTTAQLTVQVVSEGVSNTKYSYVTSYGGNEVQALVFTKTSDGTAPAAIYGGAYLYNAGISIGAPVTLGGSTSSAASAIQAIMSAALGANAPTVSAQDGQTIQLNYTNGSLQHTDVTEGSLTEGGTFLLNDGTASSRVATLTQLQTGDGAGTRDIFSIQYMDSADCGKIVFGGCTIYKNGGSYNAPDGYVVNGESGWSSPYGDATQLQLTPPDDTPRSAPSLDMSQCGLPISCSWTEVTKGNT